MLDTSSLPPSLRRPGAVAVAGACCGFCAVQFLGSTVDDNKEAPARLKPDLRRWRRSIVVVVSLVLLAVVVHFHWSEQGRKSEGAHRPFAVLFDIYLRYHEGVGDFVPAYDSQQVNVV